MQIDADPQEDQQNAPDTNYVVENPTLVCVCLFCEYLLVSRLILVRPFHMLNHSC